MCNLTCMDDKDWVRNGLSMVEGLINLMPTYQVDPDGTDSPQTRRTAASNSTTRAGVGRLRSISSRRPPKPEPRSS
ncbi:hypothetical protein SAMN05216459_13520 [Ensifer sp. OV372]|nr:hypothetical protein SAMN05216459_13520 [Ensifer sp. OV372]